MNASAHVLRPKALGLGVTLALHALVALLLLSYAPARQALLAAAPIMVDLIAPIKEQTKPEPPTEMPRPRPVARTPAQIEPPPVLAAAADAPSPIIAAPPPHAPPPPVEVAAAALLTVTTPIFNADYLENPAPAYPPLARRMGEQGRVVLRVLVRAEGTAADVQVRNSSGFARLDDAARETVRRWKFVPARRGTQAVEAWVLITISFRLEG